MGNLRVAKFGGTSVANFEAMQRCASIIKSNDENRVVLVSASAGVTNLLVELSSGELSGDQIQHNIAEIVAIQTNIINALNDSSDVTEKVATLVEELKQVIELQSEQYCPARADHILSFGEFLSSTIFAQVMKEQGVDAKWFNIKEVMKTNSLYGKAVVDIEQLAVLSKELIIPQLNAQVIVSQGFIGQDGLGNTTTLGRGGSDYSAALIAEAIEATHLDIWTDVTGIFTTDPRITSAARSIEEISFGEAAEMATFGAKVLHPATLIPAMRKQIPVFVGSSREPNLGGTQIRQTVQSKPTYRSIALRRDQSLVTVKSPAMLHASGFLAKVFGILAKHELSVDLITTSEISVAMTFDTPPGSTQAGISRAVIDELSLLSEVTVEHNLALVAIIGNGLHNAKGLGSHVFQQIESVNVRMICHGASQNNLCFLVPEADANDVVSRLHNGLFS